MIKGLCAKNGQRLDQLKLLNFEHSTYGMQYPERCKSDQDEFANGHSPRTTSAQSGIADCSEVGSPNQAILAGEMHQVNFTALGKICSPNHYPKLGFKTYDEFIADLQRANSSVFTQTNKIDADLPVIPDGLESRPVSSEGFEHFATHMNVRIESVDNQIPFHPEIPSTSNFAMENSTDLPAFGGCESSTSTAAANSFRNSVIVLSDQPVSYFHSGIFISSQ